MTKARFYELVEELAALVETAAGVRLKRAQQRSAATPTPAAHRDMKNPGNQGADRCRGLRNAVFDNEHPPTQMRVLSSELGVKFGIGAADIDNFAQRARTREVSCSRACQYRYMLPRLTVMWTHLVRQTASAARPLSGQKVREKLSSKRTEGYPPKIQKLRDSKTSKSAFTQRGSARRTPYP